MALNYNVQSKQYCSHCLNMIQFQAVEAAGSGRLSWCNMNLFFLCLQLLKHNSKNWASVASVSRVEHLSRFFEKN